MHLTHRQLPLTVARLVCPRRGQPAKRQALRPRSCVPARASLPLLGLACSACRSPRCAPVRRSLVVQLVARPILRPQTPPMLARYRPAVRDRWRCQIPQRAFARLLDRAHPRRHRRADGLHWPERSSSARHAPLPPYRRAAAPGSNRARQNAAQMIPYAARCRCAASYGTCRCWFRQT